MHYCRFCEFVHHNVNIVADHMLAMHNAQTLQWIGVNTGILRAAEQPVEEAQDVDFSE